MKRFKKFLAGVIALAMVLGMVGVMPTVKAKAEPPVVTFDAKTNRLSITNGTSKYIYIGESKNLETEPKAYTVFEAATTSPTLIDISAYAKKDIVLWIHLGVPGAGNTDVQKVKIAKSDKKLKVTLKLDETSIANRFVVKSGETTIPADDLQFRIDGGAWTALNDSTNGLAKVIPVIEQYGATIYFREIGANTGDLMFASPEAKVKYPKFGKAPKLTVDYVKGLVKYPKLIEVKVSEASKFYADPLAGGTLTALEANTWAPFVPSAEKAGTINMDSLQVNATPTTTAYSEIIFYARVASTEKKPSSALTAVKLEAAEATPRVVDKASADTNKDKEVIISIATKSATDLTYKGISVKNNYTDKIIEYALVKSEDDPDDKTKWTKLSPKGGEKILPIAAGGQDLLIRVAGVKEVTKKGEDPIPAVRRSYFVRQTLEFEISTATDVSIDSDVKTAVTAPVYTDVNKAKAAMPKVATATVKIKITNGQAITGSVTGIPVYVPVTWTAGTVTQSTTNDTVTFTATVGTLPSGIVVKSGVTITSPTITNVKLPPTGTP